MTSAPEWISVPRTAVPTVWVATSDGLVSIDLIAIELAMNGRRKCWTLSPDEARYAARMMLDREVPYSLISARVGVGTATLRTWFPGEIVASGESLARPRGQATVRTPRTVTVCGTRSGYRRHKSLLQEPCPACVLGYRAAERHYKKHGTYIGAPQITAVAA